MGNSNKREELINNATKAIEGLISIKAEKIASEATKSIMPRGQMPVMSTDLHSSENFEEDPKSIQKVSSQISNKEVQNDIINLSSISNLNIKDELIHITENIKN